MPEVPGTFAIENLSVNFSLMGEGEWGTSLIVEKITWIFTCIQDVLIYSGGVKYGR